ncbi:hypothetical protein F1880_004643 [Penicillium rolfsii]|nr:hypothetical protein F1880_004643 [Penicillium rolfsii]
MSAVIQGQITLPLYFHLSDGIINGVSFNQDSQIFSLNNGVSFTPGSKVFEPSEPSSPSQGHMSDFLEFIQPDDSIECFDHEFHAFLLGQNPRMVYIQSFLSEHERLHLIETSKNNFTPASVYSPSTGEAEDGGEYRRSEIAVLHRDSVVKCIEKRAQSLQQWTNMAFEPLAVQRYEQNGYFLHHLDAIAESTLPDRKSTFNVWLDGNCTGGGTHFPMIPRWEDPALCAYLDCDSTENGTVFKPVAGNALFWENVGPDGSPFTETVHAGLPVFSGVKLGLNIWSWEFPIGDPRGQSK